ncbi:MAG TPA: hypothetical protein V6C88_19785 [Chroococcidiopsis sp.]
MSGLIGSQFDAYLTRRLTASAGKLPSGATEYRPFYVAAKFLEQYRPQQTLVKGDGAEFTGLKKPIESLLGEQAAIDQALGLTIPAGYEAILPGCVTCSNAQAPTRFGTRSQRSTTVP